MPDRSFGGTDGAAMWGSPTAYSDGIPLPTGRGMANGSTRVAVTALLGYVAGRGAGRNVRMRLGSSQTAEFSVSASSAEQSTGWRSLSTPWYVQGGSSRFQYDVSGSCYFGRSSSGGQSTVYTTTYPGTLGGALRYIEAPTNPSSLTVSATDTPGEIRVRWGAPSNDGGASVTQYVAQVSTSSSMSNPSTHNLGTDGDTTLSGFTPGDTYYVRVAAINAVTAEQGTTSVWTSVKSLTLSAGAKVWDGSGWKASVVKVWDGSTWRTATVKVWDGAWKVAS